MKFKEDISFSYSSDERIQTNMAASSVILQKSLSILHSDLLKMHLF